MMLKNCGDVMKQIVSAYSFDKTAKTVTFTDFSNVSLNRILLITNVTANTVIYQFNNPSLGGSVSGNVVTLTYNTADMNNADKLQIIYDSAAGDPVYDTPGVLAQGTVASGSSDAGNPVKVGGRYNASPPTLADGQRIDAQADVKGNLKVTLATSLGATIDSVTAYTKSMTYMKLNADGVVANAPVALFGYYVAASSSGVISLYDNASAATGDTILATSKAVTAGDVVVLPVPVETQNGLCFDLVSGTATVLVFTRALTGV